VLFADDIVLLADSRKQLQQLLDAAYSYSERWRFKWNCGKSKVMIFGPRKVMKLKHGPYFIGMQELEVVQVFKYLGVDLQQNLSWESTKRRFVEKARSRIPLITKAGIEGLSVQAGEKLWESVVRPTLEYAAEVWGGGDWPEADRIQNAAGRALLGLCGSTSVEVARGELGWLTLKARRHIKILKYWGKLVCMENHRLVKAIYLECKRYTVRHKGSFCYAVLKILTDLKLEYLWESEQIGSYEDWGLLATDCVKQREVKEWSECVEEKEKLRWYRQFKTVLRREDYLFWEIPREHRILYARLRSGTHWLRIETGRWHKEKEHERICMACVTGEVESEAHFLLQCYIYYGLRQKMFSTIREQTGYDIEKMQDNTEWQVNALLGNGLKNRRVRRIVGLAVSSFVAAAWRKRRQELKESPQFEE
jgi:hypothetical protein